MDFIYKETVTATKSYAVPKTGTYRFHAVGKGGYGGDGGSASYATAISGGSCTEAGGGGGGGSGGYSIHEKFLQAGDIVQIKVTTSRTTITFPDGEVVYANAGASGGTGGNANNTNKVGTPGNGASGGGSVGGNIANLTGGAGGGGVVGQWYAGKGGASGAINNSLALYTPKTGAAGGAGAESKTPGVSGTAAVSNAKMLGGAGGGGGGGRAASYTQSSSSYTCSPGSGGTGGQGGVVVELAANQPPTDPTGLFYAAPNAGKPVTISWTASTDPDEGDTIQYVVERRVDNGVYQQIAITANAFYTDICPTSGTYYQVRVKAVDDKGNESGYITGTSLPINYNNPPEITGEDTDWGAITQPRTYGYTPSDPDEGNVLTVVEQVTNGAEVFTLRAFTAESGKEYTADFSSVWMLLAKGSHALVITVDDGQGGEATRTITFSRPVQRIAASRAFSTDKPVTQALISIYPGLPADASMHLEICNNPFDASPTWKDVTVKVGKYVHAFETTEAEKGPGLAYRFSITPGAMPVNFDMAVIRFKHGG